MAERAEHPRELLNLDLRGESDRIFGLTFEDDLGPPSPLTDAELEEMYAEWRSQILEQDENPPAKDALV